MSLVNRPCKSVSKWCCKKRPLYIDVCTPPTADGNGDLLVSVYVDSIASSFGTTQVPVDTTINVFVTVYGDTTNDISGIFTITAGNSFLSIVYPNYLPFENIIAITIDTIIPTSSDTQTYLAGGTTFSGDCYVPPSPTPTPTVTPTPVYFSEITSDPEASSTEACTSIFFNPDPTVGNGPTFCTSTTLTNPSYGSLPTGTYYISYGGQVVTVYITNGDNTADVMSSCSTCPTPTPTHTMTPTPTMTPTFVSYFFCMGYDSTSCSTACSDYSNCNNNN